jgi:hypothetical protein
VQCVRDVTAPALQNLQSGGCSVNMLRVLRPTVTPKDNVNERLPIPLSQHYIWRSKLWSYNLASSMQGGVVLSRVPVV